MRGENSISMARWKQSKRDFSAIEIGVVKDEIVMLPKELDSW